MKKLMAMLMVGILSASLLVGCGSEPAAETEAPEAETTETETEAEADVETEAETEGAAEGDTYTVGIIQLVEHQALDAATEGFQDALKDKLGDKVTFDYQNAQGEATNCATISTKFVNDGVDLIMANATPALQSAAAATNDIPIVGTSVTDFVTAEVVNSNEEPGTNVTGVSDLAPVDEQIALLQRVCPDVKKVAVVYCSSEANSVFQADLAAKYLEEAGIEYEVFTAADSNEIQAVITSAIADADCVYVPTDNTFADNMEIVKNVTVPAGIPVICGEENMCSVGGLATLSISYYDLGYKAGEMAYEIMVNGADPATTPIGFVSDGITAKYNPEVAESINWTIPEDLVAIEKAEEE
ncbi:MAG: ABC transporter substrate-binding protein [Lachnospiraceae bacterium]|nr:ABC transporter substrate-binding protein [Lachnospiraceae bacterium]